ncbi:MAG: flagellar biosynthesis protein FlhB [Desulfobulbaceae bacterium A2]|nr:MAG: flagellar biosynthesis protein FlhB [Desulfobulbaceae bacterium A2]
MAEEGGGERTEDATGRRRGEFRKKGQVAQSREVNTAALLTISLLFWLLYAPAFWHGLNQLMGHLLSSCGQYRITPLSLINLLAYLLQETGLLMAPVLLVGLVVGFLSTFLQIGWLFTTQPLTPDLSKLDPIRGMTRLFSKRSLVELVKSLAKLLLIGWIAWKTIQGEFAAALLLTDAALGETVLFLGRVTALIMAKICAIMIVLAVIDYAFIRWEMEEKMKMTKQEVKEEHREIEGDPHIKSKIRSIQMSMARRRMMAAVPKADVVITNPTHVAVALLYRGKDMVAPQVVAKGQELLAQRIKEIAREHNIPLIENPPLARLLHAKVEVGATIPEELFKAVAEILAHVYSIKNKKQAV